MAVEALGILRELRRRGVELEATGDRLRFRPADSVPEYLVQQIRSHKGELIAILGATSSDYVDWLFNMPLGEDLYGEPASPCHVCWARAWWERPAEHGGGWVCGGCHPDPRNL